jgi:hypothetical protein
MPTAKTRVYQWACARVRELKARISTMRERRAAGKDQTTYARMGAGAVAPSKEDLAGATGKYCEDDVEEEDEEEGEGVIMDGTEAVQRDDPGAFEAIFKSLSSSPTLWGDYGSPFSPSLSLPSSALREPEPLLYALPVPSPTISCASSSSASYDTSVPTTPITPITPTTPLSFLRPRPHPRSRAHFRTFSASIAARSPLSLSFPLSLSLPLAARRASTPGGMPMHQYMNENEQDEDRDEEDGGREGDGNDGNEDEDPFGTYGRAYYAPGARAALGLGNAYDLSAWTWARDCTPCRGGGAKRQKRHVRAERQQDPGATEVAATEPGPRPGRVYRSPIHATSAPQLSYAQPPDRELEYLRALAKATATARVARPPGPKPVRTNARDQARPAHRSGIRPLLLPQKLGLTDGGGGVLGCEMDKTKIDAMTVSGVRGRKATGWELDLERGVFCGDGVEA